MTDESTRREGFKWTCPFCDASRIIPWKDVSGEKSAVDALRTHVFASDGLGHGPRNDYPADLEPATFSHHVIAVDGRGRSIGVDE